jgi:hypothetical protein
LAAGSPWESGRFRVDAVLRCLMAPAQLSDLTGRLASIWIADLNHPDGRPDRGLALIDASVIETVPAPETFGLHGSPSPPERDRYYSAVAGSLTAVGIPTLDAAAVRRYVEALKLHNLLTRPATPAFWPSGRVSAAPTVLHRSRRHR